MNEKEQLTGDTRPQLRRVKKPTKQRVKRWLRPCIWLLSAFCAICYYYPAFLDGVFVRPSHNQPTDNRKYDGEHIEWRRCDENDGYELECSSIDVPMDQFNLSNSADKTFSIPLIRLRGKNATQNLLVNPGGPGGSGVEYIYRRGKQMKEVVGENFHLLGFDPRGINGSQPAALCYPDQETRTLRSRACKPESIHHSPEVYSWAENFVQACEDTTGEHAKYINTPQTAADMNSILDAVGQDDMFYWGFSYGTVLGQTYATMFPERSERVIIDGVCNIFEWYNSLLDYKIFEDSENALGGFFDQCIKEGDGCPLSSIADTKEKLQDKVMGYITSLQKEPAHIYVNSTVYGVLDYDTILDALFRALHKPPEWYAIADSIAKLMQGNGTQALLAYGLNGYFAATMMDHNAFVIYNDKKSGKHHWPQREDLIKLVAPLANSSIFGRHLTLEFYPVSRWRIPQTHNFVPQHGVETKHPLLILSQTYDPITPLSSARVATDAFQGSRLLEVKGYGHCSLAIHSACGIKAAREFLLHGTLPEAGSTCEVDSPYFVSPEKREQIRQRAADVHVSNEDRLWAAQLELSEGIHLSHRYY